MLNEHRCRPLNSVDHLVRLMWTGFVSVRDCEAAGAIPAPTTRTWPLQIHCTTDGLSARAAKRLSSDRAAASGYATTLLLNQSTGGVGVTDAPGSHADLLSRPLFAHLATVRPDGAPLA